jgi:hypothetical protein
VSRCSEQQPYSITSSARAPAIQPQFSLELFKRGTADTWEETSAGPIGQQILELQSYSSSEKLSRIFFFEIARGQLPPAGVPIVRGTNEQKKTRG